MEGNKFSNWLRVLQYKLQSFTLPHRSENIKLLEEIKQPFLGKFFECVDEHHQSLVMLPTFEKDENLEQQREKWNDFELKFLQVLGSHLFQIPDVFVFFRKFQEEHFDCQPEKNS